MSVDFFNNACKEPARTDKVFGICDGMLTFKDSIYLVELKEQRTHWLSRAKEQLKNTIKFLNDHNDLSEIRYKKAYACNKKHPRFTVMDNELSKRFFRETGGFRIDAQAEIIIK